MTALSKTSLPALEKTFLCHELSNYQTFSFIELMNTFFSWPTKEGKPRYFSWHSQSDIWSSYWKYHWMAWLVLGEKERADFWKLICWPKAFPYKSKTLLMEQQEDLLALQNKRLSSTNKRWVIYGAPWAIDKPFRAWQVCYAFKRLERPSVQMRKR